MSGQSSRTTHGATECIDASQLLGAMLFMALSGANKEDTLLGHGVTDIESESVTAIAKGAYQGKTIKNIRGSGYVVESLEAALWCFHNTDTFKKLSYNPPIYGMMLTRQQQSVVSLPGPTMANPVFPIIGKNA